MRLIAIVCLTAAFAFVRAAESHLPVTDADALRAGPTFITKDATLLDWPPSPKGEYRVLRKGTNEWSCLPWALQDRAAGGQSEQLFAWMTAYSGVPRFPP